MNEALYGVKPTTTKYGDMQFRYLAINAIKRIRNETPFSPQGRRNEGGTFYLLLPISLVKRAETDTLNPTVFNIIHWVDGANDSSTKRLMFQALLFF